MTPNTTQVDGVDAPQEPAPKPVTYPRHIDDRGWTEFIAPDGGYWDRSYLGPADYEGTGGEKK